MSDTSFSQAAPTVAPPIGELPAEQAARDVAVSSLRKSGAYTPEAIDAAVAAAATKATAAQNAQAAALGTNNPAAIAAPVIPAQAFVGQRDGLNVVAKIVADHPELAEAAKAAFKADYGQDFDALMGNAEDRAYGISSNPEDYADAINLTGRIDPENIGEFEAGFVGFAAAIGLPKQVAQSLSEHIVEGVQHFDQLSGEEKADYSKNLSALPWSQATKNQVANWFGASSWEQALPHFREAWGAVESRMSANDVHSLTHSGAMEDARVLLQILRHGEFLLGRKAT